MKLISSLFYKYVIGEYLKGKKKKEKKGVFVFSAPVFIFLFIYLFIKKKKERKKEFPNSELEKWEWVWRGLVGFERGTDMSLFTGVGGGPPGGSLLPSDYQKGELPLKP